MLHSIGEDRMIVRVVGIVLRGVVLTYERMRDPIYRRARNLQQSFEQ